MIEKIRGLVLHTVRHNDKNNIVTLFTEKRGRVAFLTSAGGGKAARMRNARLAPMALIESDVNFRENRDLQYLGSVNTPHPWRDIYFDPMKSAMAFFLSDFLNRLFRTSDSDPALWQWLLHSLQSLDGMQRGLPNFHIAFLAGMLPFVGIAPDIDTYSPGRVFDLRDGVFTDSAPLSHHDWIDPRESAFIPTLMRIDYRNLHLYRLNGENRRRILGILMRYYSIHLPISADLPSLDILHDLFV